MDLMFYTGQDSARSKVYSQLKNTVSKENFSDFTSSDDSCVEFTMVDILVLAIDIIIAVIAANLSWGCSGNYSPVLRVIFAILAAIFGSTYIILYILFRSDLCQKKN
jgi:hypothetical protein